MDNYRMKLASWGFCSSKRRLALDPPHHLIHCSRNLIHGAQHTIIFNLPQKKKHDRASLSTLVRWKMI